MVTALSQHQFEAQLAEDSRPPFTTVQELRDFIKSEEPSTTLNVTLRVVVLGIEETPKNYRIRLIDEDAEGQQQTDTFIKTIAMLDSARVNRVVFTLTLWKPRTGSPVMKYRVGHLYSFYKVHSLCLYIEAPQGSAQLQRPQHSSIARPTVLGHSRIAGPRSEVSNATTAQAESLGSRGVGSAAAAAIKPLARATSSALLEDVAKASVPGESVTLQSVKDAAAPNGEASTYVVDESVSRARKRTTNEMEEAPSTDSDSGRKIDSVVEHAKKPCDDARPSPKKRTRSGKIAGAH
ncbi:hypothetical protein BBJ28_00022194 [Nothophytophthora sp. Chile5]|nr:hypothetical protein BBJ28_00022194 [Nothophytophthora sp. Chile5]